MDWVVFAASLFVSPSALSQNFSVKLYFDCIWFVLREWCTCGYCETYQSGWQECWNGFEEGNGTCVRSLQKIDAEKHESEQGRDAAAYQTADDVFPDTGSLGYCKWDRKMFSFMSSAISGRNEQLMTEKWYENLKISRAHDYGRVTISYQWANDVARAAVAVRCSTNMAAAYCIGRLALPDIRACFSNFPIIFGRALKFRNVIELFRKRWSLFRSIGDGALVWWPQNQHNVPTAHRIFTLIKFSIFVQRH